MVIGNAKYDIGNMLVYLGSKEPECIHWIKGSLVEILDVEYSIGSFFDGVDPGKYTPWYVVQSKNTKEFNIFSAVFVENKKYFRPANTAELVLFGNRNTKEWMK